MGNEVSRYSSKEADNQHGRDKPLLSDNDKTSDKKKSVKYKNKLRKAARVTSSTKDTRSIKISHDSVRPRVSRGTLWEDPCFPREMAMEGSSLERKSYRWMRPKEFCERPTLVDGKPSRHDVIQGSLGNCWMMAVLAGIADHEKAIANVLVSRHYNPLSSSYDGVFRCRLWYFGQWVDIYVDDYLPVRYDPGAPRKYSLIGARSPDPNVLWVALVEKALAKFHGSYKGIEAREREYGWRLLTGGVPTILSQDFLRSTISDKMFLRIKNALNNGCVVTCSRQVSGSLHAYTVTGAQKHSSKGNIVRIRNPWGEEKHRIAWLDKPERWTYTSEENADDFKCKQGEFWVTRGTIYSEFSQFCIGSFKAEYTENNNETSTTLNHKYTFFGEWKGDSAAGPQKDDVFKNPKFQITVPGSVNKEKQILFELTPRHLGGAGVCVFLYRIITLKKSGKVLCDAISDAEQRVFLISGCPQYRYSLPPGNYLAIPLTNQSQCEMEFCFRIYSNSKIKSRPLTTTCFHADNIPDDKSKTLAHYPGKWYDLYVDEKNFASVLHKMPQYKITTAADTKIDIGLLQEPGRGDCGIGIRLYELDDDVKLPVSRDFIEQSRRQPYYRSPIWRNVNCHCDVELKRKSTYLLLVFPWNSTYDKDYVMTIVLDKGLKINCRLAKKK